MAHIQDRRGRGGRRPWRVRYRAPKDHPDPKKRGKELSESFAKKIDAERFAATVEADKARGTWVDPDRGRVPIGEWGKRYLSSAVGIKEKTRDGYEGLMRNHIEPAFGTRALASVEPIEVREWVAELATRRSASRRDRRTACWRRCSRPPWSRATSFARRASA